MPSLFLCCAETRKREAAEQQGGTDSGVCGGWVLVPAASLNHCVTLDKSFELSCPGAACWKNLPPPTQGATRAEGRP